MSLQVIPIRPSPNQLFSVQLDLNGRPLTLNVAFRYNEMASYWVLSISDASNNLLLDSIPCLTGTWPAANLLVQQKYLNIGAWYVVNVSNLVAAQPSVLGYGGGGFGGSSYGGDSGMSGIDWPNNLNLGLDFQLWVDDTPTV